MNMEIKLSGKNLSKSFRKKNAEKSSIIFSDIDLSIKSGTFMALMGPSGCGKSTLLKILAGLENPDSGLVKVDEKVIFEEGKMQLSEGEFAEFRRENFGFIFQSHQLIPELTVMENVILPLQLKGMKKNKAKNRAREMLSHVNLLDKLQDSFPQEISVGQQQRVGIARALIHQPSLIFADEPTASLDPKNSEEVIEMLLGLQEEYDSTIIMVTHSPELVSGLDGIIKFIEVETTGSYRLEKI
ncbi:MAG: ABC transporter ATP-binding protein [Deltaproteobacteria bacterium]|jgi:ABC-type lipoprotein export system ATPase subunit|nr:ABC transporter ATP-binding protein [Deltaproteobacteria bacterium]MBT5833567.1 ABC transporter ATP-binding protein [Deltaproteobacteria bacterium]